MHDLKWKAQAIHTMVAKSFILSLDFLRGFGLPLHSCNSVMFAEAGGDRALFLLSPSADLLFGVDLWIVLFFFC